MKRLLTRTVTKIVAWFSAPFRARPTQPAFPLPEADRLNSTSPIDPSACPSGAPPCLELLPPFASGPLALPTLLPSPAATPPTPRNQRSSSADAPPSAGQAWPTPTDDQSSFAQTIDGHGKHRPLLPEDLAALEQRIRAIPPFSPRRCHLLALTFSAWMRLFEMAGADRTWTVDEVWYLASEDFGPAFDVTMPARNVFLAALSQLPGVHRRHHVRRRIDGVDRKTTIYWFPSEYQQEVSTELRRQA